MKRALIPRLVLALLFLTTVSISAHAQTWWNPDFTKRLPVTIANTGASATPSPTSAEVTLSPIPAEMRADWTDLQVLYWNGSSWKNLDRQVLLDTAPNPGATPPVEGVIRVVFRLEASIPAAGSSTGQYFLYYGNYSPARPSSDIYKIYDHVVDFKSAANVVGQPAPDWEPAEPTNTMTVTDISGVKHGVLRGTVSHPRAIVKKGSMPDFLNAELYSRQLPFGGGEREMVPMLRAVNDTTKYSSLPDPELAHWGGYGYAVAGFGDQDGFVSLINPNEPPYSRGPAPIGPLVPKDGEANRVENVIARVDGQLLSGKRWSDLEPQPGWTQKEIDRTTNNPDGRATDPVYDQPGGTGIAAYSQAVAVEFIALRELRSLDVTPAAAEDGPAGGPYVQGTILSSRGNAPLGDVAVTISDGTNTYVIYTDPQGRYRMTLPAGTYSVSVSAPFHTTTSVTGVAPTAAGLTNITLPYVGVAITGSVRDKWTGQAVEGATVVLLSADHYNVGQTTTDANGNYAITAAQGGTWEVAAQTANGRGARKPFTATSGQDVTMNLLVDVLANGDVEVPNATNTYPLGWSNAEFGTPLPNAYVYSRAHNRTPGGFWAVGIDTPNGTNAWNPPSNYNVPVKVDQFDVTISLWVYFEKAGQEGRLRLRNNWPVGSVIAIAGSAPDPNNQNTGGLVNGLVPVGQWYELRSSVPAGTALAANEMGINAYGIVHATVGGTVWFDDFSVTLTPHNMIIGKVVDENGNPISGAFAGKLSDGGTAGNQPILLDSVSPTDENGLFKIYTLDNAPIPVSAIRRTLASDISKLPDYGYVGEFKNATPVPYDPNASTPTVTIAVRKATNVADGTTAEAFTIDSGGLKVKREDAAANLALDNDLWTRWSAGGNQSVPGTPKWVDYDLDLGAVKSIDQIDIAWEIAMPASLRIWATQTALDPFADPPSEDLIFDSTSNSGRGIPGYGTPWGHTSLLRYQVFRLPAAKNIRYIRIEGDLASDGHYSIYELRTLSLAEPLPPPTFTKDDLDIVLKIAGGLEPSFQSDMSLYDLNADGKIDITDAVRIAEAIRNF